MPSPFSLQREWFEEVVLDRVQTCSFETCRDISLIRISIFFSPIATVQRNDFRNEGMKGAIRKIRLDRVSNKIERIVAFVLERVEKSNSLASWRGLNVAVRGNFSSLWRARGLIDTANLKRVGTHASDKTTDLPVWNRAANNLVCVFTYTFRLTTKGWRNSAFGLSF